MEEIVTERKFVGVDGRTWVVGTRPYVRKNEIYSHVTLEFVTDRDTRVVSCKREQWDVPGARSRGAVRAVGAERRIATHRNCGAHRWDIITADAAPQSILDLKPPIVTSWMGGPPPCGAFRTGPPLSIMKDHHAPKDEAGRQEGPRSELGPRPRPGHERRPRSEPRPSERCRRPRRQSGPHASPRLFGKRLSRGSMRLGGGWRRRRTCWRNFGLKTTRR